VPPLACRRVEYAKPRVPEGMDVELIVKGVGVTGAATIGTETVVVADCAEEPESVTVMAKE